MSALIDHWFYSLQALPIEGVGELRWERLATPRTAKSATIVPSTWEVKFQSDPAVGLPTDFFTRLACFANTSVPDVEMQYRNWMKSFQSETFTVLLPGAGELKKEVGGQTEWKPIQPPSMDTATVPLLPLSADHLHRRWDSLSRFALILTGIALAFIVALAGQSGLNTNAIRSSWPVKQEHQTDRPLPYREIR